MSVKENKKIWKFIHKLTFHKHLSPETFEFCKIKNHESHLKRQQPLLSSSQNNFYLISRHVRTDIWTSVVTTILRVLSADPGRDWSKEQVNVSATRSRIIKNFLLSSSHGLKTQNKKLFRNNVWSGESLVIRVLLPTFTRSYCIRSNSSNECT